MPSEGEIRYDREDMREDAAEVARMLDVYGRVAFAFAAHGTRHAMMAIDSAPLLVATNSAREPGEYEPPVRRPLWLGGLYGMPAGLGDPREVNSHTLWVREDGGNQFRAVWFNHAGYHDPKYVHDKLIDNMTDATALAIFLLLVEVERGLEVDVEDTANTWLDWAAEHFNVREERPAFLAGKGSNDDD